MWKEVKLLETVDYWVGVRSPYWTGCDAIQPIELAMMIFEHAADEILERCLDSAMWDMTKAAYSVSLASGVYGRRSAVVAKRITKYCEAYARNRSNQTTRMLWLIGKSGGDHGGLISKFFSDERESER